MFPEQRIQFTKDLDSLCKKYGLAVFAGFYLSSKGEGPVNSAVVVCPYAKENKVSMSYANMVTAELMMLLNKCAPAPDSIDFK